jgi:hypothetical protein
MITCAVFRRYSVQSLAYKPTIALSFSWVYSTTRNVYPSMATTTSLAAAFSLLSNKYYTIRLDVVWEIQQVS